LLYIQQSESLNEDQSFEVTVQFRGGRMKVGGTYNGSSFDKLYLSGPANGTFKGLWPGIARSTYGWSNDSKTGATY
ncbi:MAG: hypothetical protein ACKOPP_00810, partial [Bacteroidota bacterium]